MLAAGKLQLRAHTKKGIERGTAARCRDWNRFRKFDNACSAPRLLHASN